MEGSDVVWGEIFDDGRGIPNFTGSNPPEVYLRHYDINTAITTELLSLDTYDHPHQATVDFDGDVVVYTKRQPSALGTNPWSVFAYNIETDESVLVRTESDYDLDQTILNGHVVAWQDRTFDAIYYKDTPWRPVLEAPSISITYDNPLNGGSLWWAWTYAANAPDYFEGYWMTFAPLWAYGLQPWHGSTAHYGFVPHNELPGSGQYYVNVRACDANDRRSPWAVPKSVTVTIE